MNYRTLRVQEAVREPDLQRRSFRTAGPRTNMALLGLLGMHPIAAYPIVIGSDGVLIPVASLGFMRSGRFSHGS